MRGIELGYQTYVYFSLLSTFHRFIKGRHNKANSVNIFKHRTKISGFLVLISYRDILFASFQSQSFLAELFHMRCQDNICEEGRHSTIFRDRVSSEEQQSEKRFLYRNQIWPENSEKNKIRGGGAELSNIVFLMWSSLNFVIQRYRSVMNQLAKAEENHRVKCGDVKNVVNEIWHDLTTCVCI